MQLPVDLVLPTLRAHLRATSRAVLSAPPGAGKTTRVPLALLDEAWTAGRKIVLLSPRRVAARAAAQRMASTLGEPVGETVGFRVRLETKVSARTRIEVVTEGVFTRMILADPELAGVAAVLFDEFHERSLEGDLGLALALDAQAGLREDLRIVVMSATLDTARVAALLDDAPTVASQGRMHPVALRYRGRDPRARVEDAMADAVIAALSSESGSLLCFLPGAREIERTAERLRERVREAAVEVHALYGALDPRAQDAAIAPAPQGVRKVVLATSIAETSLTIEGVRVVIDCGLSRRPRYEVGSGLTRLETGRASRASVDQRAGRAGRTEPGVCWRMWDEAETRALPAFDAPEILESDLSGLVLDLAAWGLADPSALKWLDPPPTPAWTQAVSMLKDLSALDEAGRLTPEGRAIAALPLHPRLAHMASKASESGETALAARIAMIVSEQGLGGRDIDLRERLRRLDEDRSPRAGAAKRAAAGIARRLGGREGDRIDLSRAGALLALAYPERVAMARGKRGEFVMAGGRGAVLDENDALAKAPFLAIAEAAGRAEKAQIVLAAALSEADVEALFGDRIETATEASVDASGVVRARRVRRLGRIVLSEAPLERPDAATLRALLLRHLTESADARASLINREPVRQLRARLALARRVEGEAWPDAEAAIEGDLDWLTPALDGARGLADISDGDVVAAILDLLDYPQRRRLDELAPTHFDTPAGSRLPIDYACENGPALEVRLQELFGEATHPAVAGGRAPLLLRLLSPAHRPVQTTRDLPGFWKGSYAGVRADLRGRYPKHPWPDDPLSAPPTRRAKPRGT